MRRLMWALPIIGAGAMSAAMLTQSTTAAIKGEDLKAITNLPVTQVVMFSSGVGYFARSTEIEGSARVDLTFQERDINDLLKSMVLQDFGKGQVSAVSYDSREPINRTLASFAINLNGNPTFADILNQARGEQIEVVLQQNVAAQPGNLKGSIIGVEKQKLATHEVDVLNMWCQEGMRSVKLTELQRLRFLNPVIENEVRRALETLSLNHDQLKKAVSIQFVGEGKRKVQVGYVVENLIWKTSYRLVLDKEGKPFLQGWAIVENPTDEDWNAVSMALISGRPISFKMDLYNPLYVTRPTVEPELFASLRPPTYSGNMMNGEMKFGDGNMTTAEQLFASPMSATRLSSGTIAYRGLYDFKTIKPLGIQNQDYAEQLKKPLELTASPSVATASQLGDVFQYIIDQPVDLGRQKSALLPIINKDIQASRVSIYNQGVQAKHPLLGLRLKNTTGVHLMQGPITVFEGSTYAGDTRVLDVQPNEERLVSYAIDLGTEVDPTVGNNTSRITKVRAIKGIIETTTRIREEKVYRIANRSPQDRTVLIEHANRKNQEFKVVSEIKPIEETGELYRFETKVAAGKNTQLSVIEERDLGTSIQISNSPDDQIRYFVNLNEVSPGLKVALNTALKMKGDWDATRREIENVNRSIQTITTDQTRLRQNLREMPREAEAYKTYLKKFDDQEKEMDALMTKLKTLQELEHQQKSTYENYLASLSVE